MKPTLTIELLLSEARTFCVDESTYANTDLYGVTDGKAVGTYIEHKLHKQLERYDYLAGSSAKGIDLPSESINTDIKVTSIRQPQSSCPYRNARQKIYGLGYNLLLLVYDKIDLADRGVARLNFLTCAFIHDRRTADFTMTRTLRQMVESGANQEEIISYLSDRNLPVDEIGLTGLAEEILSYPPEQGYLTISNAFQWRLQYSRIVNLTEEVEGIIPIIQI